jgi:hypothetical protein
MEPPIGFVRLRDAADLLGQAIAGKRKWRPLAKIKPETIITASVAVVDRVIRLIAEQCEAGEIEAVYRSITGADSLNRNEWRKPGWRLYFATGMIDLELPLVDENLRPDPNGYTVRYQREIYLKRQDLERVINTLKRPTTRQAPASSDRISRIVRRYRDSLPAGSRPTMRGVEAFAKDKEGLLGHRAELRAEYNQQCPTPVGRPKN